MSTPRTSKRDLERLRREKAARKAEKRQARAESAASAAKDAPGTTPQEVVLDSLAALHKRFSDDQLPLDEFEEQRDHLLAQLRVD